MLTVFASHSLLTDITPLRRQPPPCQAVAIRAIAVAGPGIAPNSSFAELGSNVDLMPTLLGLAGVETPPTMDGRSAVPLFLSHPAAAPSPTSAHHEAATAGVARAAWRTELLLEYYGLAGVLRYEHLQDTPNNTYRALRRMQPSLPPGRRNLKLVEFTDWSNWNFTSPAGEFELFDLAADPWEMTNLYAGFDPDVKAEMHAALERAYRCQGQGGGPEACA